MDLCVEIFITFVFIFTLQGLSQGSFCDEALEIQNGDIFPCKGVFFQPICLICKANRTETDVRWYVRDRQLTHDGFNLDGTQAGGIWINHGCLSDKYSLHLRRPSTENQNEIFYCMKRDRVVSRFKLELRVVTHLFINSTGLIIFNKKLLLFREDAVKNLQCVVEGSIPPLSLTWSLNGVSQTTETFTSTAERFTINVFINLQNLTNLDLLTCSSKGEYIDSDNVSLTVTFVETASGDNSPSKVQCHETSFEGKWVAIAAAVVVMPMVTMYFIIHSCKRPGSSMKLPGSLHSAVTGREAMQIELGKVCSQRSIRTSRAYVEDSVEGRKVQNLKEMHKNPDLAKDASAETKLEQSLPNNSKNDVSENYSDIHEYERCVFSTKTA